MNSTEDALGTYIGLGAAKVGPLIKDGTTGVISCGGAIGASIKEGNSDGFRGTLSGDGACAPEKTGGVGCCSCGCTDAVGSGDLMGSLILIISAPGSKRKFSTGRVLSVWNLSFCWALGSFSASPSSTSVWPKSMPDGMSFVFVSTRRRLSFTVWKLEFCGRVSFFPPLRSISRVRTCNFVSERRTKVPNVMRVRTIYYFVPTIHTRTTIVEA